MSDAFVDNGACFLCGKNNPFGLKLDLRMDETAGAAETELSFPSCLQGWNDVVHGGMLAAVLDEVMVYAAGATGVICVTGEITVRYMKPVATRSPVKARGWVTGRKGRVVSAEAEIVDAKGEIATRATGKLIVLRDGKK